MEKRVITRSEITSVADAIRKNKGITNLLVFPEEFVDTLSRDRVKDFASLLAGTLEHFESDAVTKIGSNALYMQQGIKSMRLSNLTEIAFQGCCYCSALEFADLGATNLADNAFYGCEKLKTLILRSSTMCAYGGTAFNATPFASGGSGGIIYVPAVLIGEYQSKWGGVNCTFKAIEDSIYNTERTITDFANSSLEELDDYAFINYDKLCVVNTPKITKIGTHSFYNCENLTSINVPKATEAETYAFCRCGKLPAIDLPETKKIDKSAFAYCTSLESINCPKVEEITTYAFAGCTALSDISPLNVKIADQGTFMNCSALSVLDLPVANNIRNQCFKGCSSLTTLILRNSNELCTLANPEAFANTPFAAGNSGGTIYVPAALKTAYESDTNWSVLSCTFEAIEGSEYE